MPYDIRKRSCKQSDGKKGEYVVVKKSEDRTEQKSCHTTKEKAKGALSARYANKANEGETVKITLEELRQLISEAMAEVTRPLPVYEEDAEILTTYEEGEEDLEEAIETTIDSDVVKNYLDVEGGAAGAADTVAAVRAASDTDDDQALSDDEILAKVKDIDGVEQHPSGDLVDTATLTEAVMVALQPMIKPVHQEMTRDEFWMKIAGIDTKSLNEGDVVDLFPKDKPAPQDKDMLANALAKRAMEMVGQRADRAENMVDLDGYKNNIDVNIDIDFDPEFYRIFLSPYIDDYDGKESPPLADQVYNSYVLGMAGDHAEKMDDIIERIGIDYFDEDIVTVMKSAGDDRFGGSQDQMITSPVSGDSNEDWIYDLEGEMEAKMRGMESGKVAELEQEED